MKNARLLWAYSKGIRLAALVLLLVSCYALFSTVEVVQSLKIAYDDYAYIKDADLLDSYSFVPWDFILPGSEEEAVRINEFLFGGGYEEMLHTMEIDPAVDAVGTMCYYKQPIYSMEYYDAENPDKQPEGVEEIMISAVNPGLFSFFPNLQKELSFQNPTGVYLVGGIFEGLAAGDTLRCFVPTVTELDSSEPPVETTYPGFQTEFPVEGRLPLPLILPWMGCSSNVASERDIVKEQEVPFLLMLDTEESREALTKMGFTMREYDIGFYLRYKETATKEEMERVESNFNFLGGTTPVGEVQENLTATLKAKFLDQLPGAVVRIFIMLLCYVSLIVLTVSKKRKEMAVSYICGATKEKNAWLLTSLLFLATVPAGILNLLHIYFVPGGRQAMFEKEQFHPSLQNLLWNKVSVYTVLLYFAMMLLWGWLLVKGTLGRRSPIDAYKEATK